MIGALFGSISVPGHKTSSCLLCFTNSLDPRHNKNNDRAHTRRIVPQEKDMSAVEDHVDLTREKTQTRGLAATLKIVKLKGDIKDAKSDTFAGRANDEKPIRLDKFGDRVKLDHRDRFGNLLTPKEVAMNAGYWVGLAGARYVG